MGKRIYWVLVAFITICGMSTLVYFAIQPRPVPKFPLSQFASHHDLVDRLFLNLKEEIRKSPLLMLGVETTQADSIAVWKLFLQKNQDPGMRYDVVVADEGLNGVEDIQDIQILDTKEQKRLITGLRAILAQRKRVVILVPNIYSVQMVPGNIANHLRLKFPELMSVSMTDFPRSRDEEKQMAFRCITGLDESGLGPFGCLLVQTARAQYRKKFEPGATLGLMNQIGLKDYLLLYTQEPQ